ncbi:MAG: hypothetical protein U0270_12860 [Labilithrix sp.]
MRQWIGILACALALFWMACGGDDSEGEAPAGVDAGSSTSSSGAASSSSGDGGSSSSSSSGATSSSSSSSGDGGITLIPQSEIVETVFVNELAFELPRLLGKKVWVLGYYGDKRNAGDGMGTIVDDPKRLLVDEAYPKATMARLSGTLPSPDWEYSEVLVYGEIKDYAVVTGNPQRFTTPLIVVEKSIQRAPKAASFEGAWVPSTRPVGPAPQGVTVPNAGTGTQASPCDRSVIISGGVDASNNHPRYVENLIAKFKKMKSFGFTDSQIEVFYDNGTALDADGTNPVDKKATKKDIVDHLNQLALDMPGSCTLTIFVTDHGTGYSDKQNYYDQRVATTGPDATGGKQYQESTFAIDVRWLAYRRSELVTIGGKPYWIRLTEDNKLSLWTFDAEYKPKYLGTDANGDGVITEKEANTDIDGDGTVAADHGLDAQYFKDRLVAEVIHQSTFHDTDKDGTQDFRIRWDGTAKQYVIERFLGGDWKEIGRDKNDDFHIDAADGGIDWNGDGDVNDTVGFHEGINLWGDEVLWDDELAALMKKLNDKGVHTMIEMVSCFSGGFVENVKGLVENIVTGSPEDDKHYNRVGADELAHAVDELTFLEKLQGIDSASWSAAWDLAKAADDAAATANNSPKNPTTRYETPIFTTTTKFQEAASGTYNVELHFPPDQIGKVYDFEIIFGLQQPRWDALQFGGFSNLPVDYDDELIPGGVRVFRSTPIPDGFKFKVKGTGGTPKLRIEFTDLSHARLGYTIASPGTVTIAQTSHASAFTIGFQHFSGFSHVKGQVTVVDNLGLPLANATVTLNLNGGSPQTFTTNASGVADYFFVINVFGTYTVNLTNIAATGYTYAPADNVASSKTVVVN